VNNYKEREFQYKFDCFCTPASRIGTEKGLKYNTHEVTKFDGEGGEQVHTERPSGLDSL